MTLAEVEHILGSGLSFPNSSYQYGKTVWIGDDGSAAIAYFSEDLVTGKLWHQSTESTADMLRRWFHPPK